MTLAMVQIFALQLLPMSMISALAAGDNELGLGFMALVSSVIATLGTVYVSTRKSTEDTNRIIEAVNLARQSAARNEEAVASAATEAADKVARTVVVAAEQPIPVEVVATPENPLPVTVVDKEPHER